MDIAFETSNLATDKPTGIGRYTRKLIENIIELVTDNDSLSLHYKLSRIKRRHTWWQPINIDTHIHCPPFWPLHKQCDVLHGMDGWVPNWRKCYRIATIHDLLPLKESDTICSGKFKSGKQKKYEQVCKIADAIITPSETTKNDVIELLGIPENRIFVTHLGIGDEFYPRDQASIQSLRDEHNIKKDYLLYVGSVSARKNIIRLLQAYADSSIVSDIDLVLAGNLSFGSDDILNQISKLGVSKQVQILNYISDDDLPTLYSGATGFVFPTLYEGFGMPQLEAMACNTSVLTSTTGASPEVCKQHAIYTDPYDVASITNGINQILQTTDEQRTQALEYAKTFTWKRCAEQTLSVYKKLCTPNF